MARVTVQSNNLDNIVVGALNANWSVRGDRIIRYYIDIRHKKLNLHKEVSAPEIYILQSKMDALMAAWDEKYEQYIKKQNLVSGHTTAEDMTTEALAKLDSLNRILVHTLTVDDRVDWDSLKDHSNFKINNKFPEKEPLPKSVQKPTKSTLSLKENEKSYERPEYSTPRFSIFNVVFGQKAKIISEHDTRYNQSIMEWEEQEKRNQAAIAAHEAKYQSAVLEWERQERQREENYAEEMQAWKLRKQAFLSEQQEQKAQFEAAQSASNGLVDKLRDEVKNGDADAVIEHTSLVLEASNYRGLFEKSYLVQYDREKRLLKLAYDLPSIDTLPSVKSVKFVKATGELKESYISDREKKSNFESICYQICLRTVHELFEADEHRNIDSILFNGFVDFINPATGVEERSCILSLLVDRDAFMKIDLARVDPKACFKSHKGVSAASLASLVAIPPVMEMDTEDRRFVEAREVGSGIDEGTNLAAISWEDFEHLVREIFDREFASRGGEVKVTQASSDGGVDAIAFDPDPITGGKIVIQAKRYTRTVGVSAVRDLYGTLMNEGASRGILVTTADYGPDAYSFANGKPLTLMNGAHLLHMMQRHGFKAKIDLREARALLVEGQG